MAKTKAKTQNNGATSVQPWQIQTLVDKQAYQFAPLLLEAMRSLEQQLIEIKEILKEK